MGRAVGMETLEDQENGASMKDVETLSRGKLRLEMLSAMPDL